ncbi:S8 family peptidase [Isoptericola sp. b515]|uniref:S8 family peptidase n=1 Tax=Isoptericola sp. b515 TaxID=3064652 RepID=UPI002712E6C4|nr:S8 family peptidase [Isoptericola sp. b515]MDO8149219.1 S8 family peptidase [Isoptericola sp. b515]
MHKKLLAVWGTAALAAASVAVPASAAPPETNGYIVMLSPSANTASVAAQHSRAADVAVAHVYTSAIRGYSATMSATAAARLADDPRVLLVQPDGVVTTTAQTTPTGIDRVDAELSSTAAIDGADTRVDVDVAVIDSGVDLDHPDINVYEPGAMNCSTGRSANDGNGHGTHVAGTIGALDDSAGVVGVAPGARIWPVRVLNNAGSGQWSDVICGIDFVAANADQIEVANMSLGGTGTDNACGSNTDAMHEAICAAVDAGVTFVVAAGNESDDSANHLPAAYDEVITVSALADFNGLPGGGAAPTCRTDVDDTFAGFSNYGADVDLIAPGVCITSTWKGGGYDTISGTSMASPHVAGGAALYQATHPSASPAQVKSALQSAGTTDWNDVDDPDGTKEKLLNVAGF